MNWLLHNTSPRQDCYLLAAVSGELTSPQHISPSGLLPSRCCLLWTDFSTTHLIARTVTFSLLSPMNWLLHNTSHRQDCYLLAAVSCELTSPQHISSPGLLPSRCCLRWTDFSTTQLPARTVTFSLLYPVNWLLHNTSPRQDGYLLAAVSDELTSPQHISSPGLLHSRCCLRWTDFSTTHLIARTVTFSLLSPVNWLLHNTSHRQDCYLLAAVSCELTSPQHISSPGLLPSRCCLLWTDFSTTHLIARTVTFSLLSPMNWLIHNTSPCQDSLLPSRCCLRWTDLSITHLARTFTFSLLSPMDWLIHNTSRQDFYLLAAVAEELTYPSPSRCSLWWTDFSTTHLLARTVTFSLLSPMNWLLHNTSRQDFYLLAAVSDELTSPQHISPSGLLPVRCCWCCRHFSCCCCRCCDDRLRLLHYMEAVTVRMLKASSAPTVTASVTRHTSTDPLGKPSVAEQRHR